MATILSLNTFYRLGTIGNSLKFIIKSKDKHSLARTGRIQTDHSVIETPVFMPVGTHGIVKSISPNELYDLNTQIMLSNTYHLYLRPGTDIIEENGGLHQFLNWSNSILTDSGGYQVFSLNKMNKITDNGVHFKSHLDGSMHLFTPEISMEVQQKLGSDIIMAFDYCPPADCTKTELKRASKLTHDWTKKAYDYLDTHKPLYNHGQVLFPIIQGGVDKDERTKCLEQMLPFANCGIAIGGLSVGEKKEPMFDTVHLLGEAIPKNHPRYLMGVGKPTDIVKSVLRGIDMFDCVLPTRNARNGQLFTSEGIINIINSKYKHDISPIDENSNIAFAKEYSKSYLRYLFQINEILGIRIATLINIAYYFDLMNQIKFEINNHTFVKWSEDYLKKYENSE